jgi:DNA invertase Pin-like site-specific DNA recombinase
MTQYETYLLRARKENACDLLKAMHQGHHPVFAPIYLTRAAGKLMLTMLAAVAEMERDLLVERTQSGLARAKVEGKTLGRPTRTTEEQRAEMAMQHQAGESISALARTFNISRASVMRVVKPAASIQYSARETTCTYLQNPASLC